MTFQDFGQTAGAREFIQLATAGEDEESDLDVTEKREVACFLDQSISPLRESDLSTDLLFDSL